MANNRYFNFKRAADCDSKFEEELRKGVLQGLNYHVSSIDYPIYKKYAPDWTLELDGKTIYIEAKGVFTEREEASKYVWVRKALKPNEELVFLFYNPDTKLPFAKKRKDGTKMTHAEWADKNKFRWFTKKTIVEILPKRS